MNEAIKAEVLAAVAKWRPRLRLMDWSFAYEWDSDKTDMSKVITEPSYRRAKLFFSASFPKTAAEDGAGSWLTAEKAVVHELVHIVVTRLHVDARGGIMALRVSEQAERQVLDRVYAANEYVTEAVARIVWEAYEGTLWDAEEAES